MTPIFYSGYISSTQNPEQQYETDRPHADGYTQAACVRDTQELMTACEAEGYLRETCLPWMPARIVRITHDVYEWMWGVWIVGPDTDISPAQPTENFYEELRRAQNYVQDCLLSETV